MRRAAATAVRPARSAVRGTLIAPSAHVPTLGDERIRLCLVVASLDCGGAENQVVELAARLDPERFDTSIALLTHPGEMFEEVRKGGIRVDLVRPTKPRGPWSDWLDGLIVRLEEDRPEVVHGFIFPTYLITALAAAKVGGIAAVAGVRSLSLGFESRFPYSWLERLGNRLSDCVVGNSEAVRAAAIHRDPGIVGKFQVIHNGIDVDKYGVGADRLTVRRSLGLGDEHFVVLMVANLIRYKGHREAIQSFARIRAANTHARLVLVGTGPEEEALRRMADELGIAPEVMFLGRRRDVPVLLSAADVFLLASHEEGFPNAVLEAMAAALPIVATDVGGLREQIGGGEAGVLVPARDCDAMAAALDGLATNAEERRRIGEAARDRVRRAFSWDTAVARHAALYAALAS